jgi:hypothetical protein
VKRYQARLGCCWARVVGSGQVRRFLFFSASFLLFSVFCFHF